FTVKTPFSGKAYFQIGERLIAGVLELIVGFNENARLGRWEKLNANFLLFNGIAGAERNGAGDNAKNGNHQQEIEENSRWSLCQQNKMIVTGISGKKKRGGWLARLAATDPTETSVGVIPLGFALGDFLFRGFVGHAGVDAVEDLPLTQTGI